MSKHSLYHLLIYLFLGLTVFGLIMVGNASPVTANRDFGNKWHYLRLQATWASFGLICFVIALRIPHTQYEKFATTFFLIAIGLLVIVLIPGIGSSALGARRWISIGPMPFQPAELAKLATAIYLASLFKSRPRFGQFIIIASVLAFLIMLEPDMGTTIVILGICLFAYIGCGGPVRPLIFVGPLVGLIAAGLIFSSPYRAARLKTFIDYSHDPLGASYQIRQALISLGSGGIFGVGLGQSRQKYDFLPEVTTDSIFAVVGEEMGLIGTALLSVAFLGITLTGLQISKTTSSKFSSNLALTISCWLGMQSFINMSANIALLPFTGIPLPYISYGGTALLVNLTASGILANIAKLGRT